MGSTEYGLLGGRRILQLLVEDVMALKDYERVKLLLKRGMEAGEISSLIGQGKRVVLEYVELVTAPMVRWRIPKSEQE